jgi:uncharacterized protein (DUF2147 family)
VRDRVQHIAGSLLASHLSDPSAARGQVIGLLGQTLAQWAPAARYGEALIALGAMLFVALAGILLVKFGNRHAGQRVSRIGSDFPRSTRSHAVPLAATIPSRFRPFGFAAMLPLAGRHVLLRFAVALAIGVAASSAFAAPEGSPLGTWSTANGQGVVAIDRCGDALCGRIVGIERTPTEPVPTDVEGRPQCGLTIITNERPQPDGTWLGQVTDPRDGGVYQAKLWLDERGNLRLRGFIGIPALGATQTWHRFTGHLTVACGLA